MRREVAAGGRLDFFLDSAIIDVLPDVLTMN